MQYKNKLLAWMSFGYGLLMIVLIGMLTGLMILNSNVLYSESALVNFLDISITLVDIFAYAIAAAVVIYSIFLYGVKNSTTIFASYFCFTVFHYIALLCISWLVFPNTLPTSVQDLLLYFWEDALMFILFDCLRIFVISLFAYILFKKHSKTNHAYNRAARILNNELRDSRYGVFPITKFISFKNPIQLLTIVTVLIYWLTYFFQMIHIVNLVLMTFEYVEGLEMVIVYLLIYAVFACICYCIMLFIMMKYDEAMPKKDE